MNLPIFFRPAAQEEFEEAARWYETQRAGLGANFIRAVEAVVSTIAQSPERYPVAEGDVRYALVSRFPYSVYYRVRTDRISVLAVFHTSRNPERWQRRAAEEPQEDG
jgi:plasmid stabilization system protein ParE